MSIKTSSQISILKENGHILFDILNILSKQVISNTPTLFLENSFLDLCKLYNVVPACKGYSPKGLPPFPTGLCVSINSESVHCFPKSNKIIKEGDIVTIDTVIQKNGLYVDSAINVVVPYINPTIQQIKDYNNKTKLSLTAKNATLKAISYVKDGVRVGDLGYYMSNEVKKNGFNVLTDYAGHGIGANMHESPEIPCFGHLGNGPTLKSGMTICVEALVCEGDSKLVYNSAWETQMKDKKNWAQFEHTVLVTKEGYELLTFR